MQIHAHVDAQVQQQIDFLKKITGQNLEAVLSASVQHYYTQVRAKQYGLENFSAFIGKTRSGRSDVAGSYKKQLETNWGDKYQGASGPESNK